MITFSHPTGNANVRAACTGFAEAKLLFEFYTSIATFPGSLLHLLGAIRPLSEIRRRNFPASLAPMTRTFPWPDLGRLFALKAGMKRLIVHEKGRFCIDSVYRGIDGRVALRLRTGANQSVKAVYAYEDGAVSSFKAAKLFGLQCFYDLPIGYWRSARRLLEAERVRWPAWSSTLTGFKDSEEKLCRKEEELRLADRIFVASQFTAKTLQEFPGVLAPIEVIPYGFPPVFENRLFPLFSHGRKLKVLFVGGLSQRKGIADLFTVVERLKDYITLTVVGKKVNNNCTVLDAALSKHRWISALSHEKVLQLMREHDVLVFPSLFEGFGLVITEAMSQGTPVITTDRTAGPDLIRHGENGWLIEAGSTEALREAIEELLYHPNVIAEAGREALETARRRPWDQYGRELAEAVGRHLCSVKSEQFINS